MKGCFKTLNPKKQGGIDLEEKEKRTIEEDANVYKVLAMLLEPMVAKEYEKMKAENAYKSNIYPMAMNIPKSNNVRNCA